MKVFHTTHMILLHIVLHYFVSYHFVVHKITSNYFLLFYIALNYLILSFIILYYNTISILYIYLLLNVFAPTRTFAHDDILWTCTHGGCYATAGVGWGGVGSGWWHSLNLNTWWMLRTHGGCYATAGVGGVGSGWWHSLNLHTWWMLRNCWGGVGWGGVGMMTFFGLAHMVDATQLLGWGGVGMMTFFELAHMVDATQLLGWGGVGWAGDDDILWTCTHGGCYATAGVGWGGVGSGWWHSLNLNTWWMLRHCWGGVGWGRDDDILWTWTHGGCYAHMVDATQLLGWGGVGWGWWHSLNLHKKHGWLTGDAENASKLEEAEERTAWYEPCQEKKGPSAARAIVRVAANVFCCIRLSSIRSNYMLVLHLVVSDILNYILSSYII